MRRIPAESYAQAASTKIVKLSVRSKLMTCMPGVELPIHARNRARDRDRNIGPSRSICGRWTYRWVAVKVSYLAVCINSRCLSISDRIAWFSIVKGVQKSKYITLVSIACVMFKGIRSKKYFVIAYDHLKLYVVLLRLHQPHFACARLENNFPGVHPDWNCAVH